MPNTPPVPADPATAAYCAEVVGAGAASVSLRLFSNDYIPNPPDDFANFVEPVIPEYAPVTGGDWLGPFVTDDNVPYLVSPIRRFFVGKDSESVATVRGSFLTIAAGGAQTVIQATRFGSPYTLKAGADALSVMPTLYLSVLPPVALDGIAGITPGLQALLAAQIQRIRSSRHANRLTWRGLRRAKLQHLLTFLGRVGEMDGREVIRSDAEGRPAYLFSGTGDVAFIISIVQTYAQAALESRGG